MLKTTCRLRCAAARCPAPMAVRLRAGAARHDRAPAAAQDRERSVAGAGRGRRQPRRAGTLQVAASTARPHLPPATTPLPCRWSASRRWPRPSCATTPPTTPPRHSCVCRAPPMPARCFHALRERKPHGVLSVSSAHRRGGSRRSARRLPGARSTIYESLVAGKNTINDDVLSRLGRAALAAGDRSKAAEAYLRVYYEFPLTDAAIAADAQLDTLRDDVTRVGFKADLGRAQILYGARRYPEARAAFAAHPEPAVRGRARAGRPAHRRVRFLPEALRRDTGRRAALPGQRGAQGRSTLLRAQRAARARPG